VLERSLPCLVLLAGELTAAQALVDACEECVKVCNHVRAVFDNAVQLHKQQQPQTNK